MDTRTIGSNRLFRRFPLFFLILAAGSALLFLLGRELILSRLQAGLVRHMAEEYGLALTVEKTGGTVYGDLRLEGIQGRRLHERALIAELDIAGLRIEYSLFDLFRGEEVFLARMRIRAAGGGALLDLAGSLSPDADDDPPPVMPAVLPRLALHGFDLVLVHGETPLLACGDASLVMAGETAGSGRPVRLESPTVRLYRGETAPAPVRLDLFYRPDSLVVQGLTVAGKSVAVNGRLAFPTAESPASFTGRLLALGGEITGSGRLAPETVDLALGLESLDLAAVSALLLPAGAAMTGRLTAALSGRFPPTLPEDAAGNLHVAGQGTFRGEKFAVALQATMEAGELAVDSLTAEFAANTLRLRQGGVSVATLRSWPALEAAEVELAYFSLHCTDIPALWQAAGRRRQELHPLPPRHSLELTGSIRDRVLVIDTGRFRSKKNQLHLERATFALPGGGESFRHQPLSGKGRFSLADIGEVAALLGLAEISGSAHGDLDISGTMEKPAGHFVVQGRGVRFRRWAVQEVRLEVRADRERVRVLSAEARQEADRLHLRGVWSLVHGKVERLEGELLVRDLGHYGPLLPLLGPEAAGRLEAWVTTTEKGEQHLRAGLRDARLAGISLSSGQVELSTDWRAVAISRLALAGPQGSLDLTGTVSLHPAQEKFEARLEHLALARSNVSLHLEKPVAFTVFYGEDKSLTLADSLLLRGNVGSLAASGHLSLRGESRFQVRAGNLTGNGWLEEFTGPGYSLQGLDLDLAMQGPFSSPEISLAATVDALAGPQLADPLTGNVDVVLTGNTVRIKTFAWSNSRGQRLTAEGTAPFAPFAAKKFLSGPIDIRAVVALPDLREGIPPLSTVSGLSGDLAAELILRGTWELPRGRMQFTARNLKLPDFREYALPEPVTAECGLSLEQGRLLFQDCRVQSPSLSARLSGRWLDLPSVAEMFEPRPDGLPGRVALEGSLRIADISWLRRRMPSLRRLGGDLETSFSIRGPAARPDFSGRLLLKNGTLRSNNPQIPALDGLRAEAEYGGDTFRVTSASGLLGGGPFQARGTVSPLLQGEPHLDFTIQGKDLLFFRDADMRIRGNGDLRLQGLLSGLDLSGSLAISEGQYTKNFDFLSLLRGTARPRSDIGMQAFSLPDPPLRDMRLRIEVSALAPFQIRNNLARGAVRPLLVLAGSGEIPVLAGRIYVDPVRIALPAGTLTIESGIITFPETDPDRPTFDLAGRSRLAGYDIRLRFQGTAEEPIITLSSQPPLPDDDLLLLVLTGQPPADPRGGARRSMAGMNVALYLGRGLLASWFGNGSAETDESLLERFEVEIGRQITASGQGTVDAQFRLKEGVFLPGDRLYITSEKDVFDSFNVGVKLVFRFR